MVSIPLVLAQGWLHRFKNRHGTHQLDNFGEKINSDNSNVIEYKKTIFKHDKNPKFGTRTDLKLQRNWTKLEKKH
jgi:hypothetical protein